MATIKMKGPKFKITAANLYLLGDDDEARNGGWLVQIVDDGTLSASITVKGQAQAAQVAGATSYVGIPYRKGGLNATTGSDWTFVVTAITTNSLIFIPAGGMAVGLDVTSYTSGSATVYCTPVIGSCAF